MAEQGTNMAQENIREAVRLTRVGKYPQALELFENHLLGLTGGTIADKRVAAGAFSYYGLCIAMVRRKYAQAVEYCNISLKANFMDPDHRANLAMIYLERGERRKAVETLNAGLRLEPNNTQINQIFDRIGRRRPPVISFLSRDHPLNVWLGRKRAQGESRGQR
jgi:tetratricopeptide (TPR) repeat protein